MKKAKNRPPKFSILKRGIELSKAEERNNFLLPSQFGSDTIWSQRTSTSDFHEVVKSIEPEIDR